jgi:osmotically inducible protein OsmC
MKQTATAQWYGNLKEGKGTLRTAGGTLADVSYSFQSRFEKGRGVNPEELLAAAHAGCFTMALSAHLARDNVTAESIETTCSISLEQQPDGFAITESRLVVKARVPGATQACFDKAVENAKTDCPVSKLYKTNIAVTAQLQ